MPAKPKKPKSAPKKKAAPKKAAKKCSPKMSKRGATTIADFTGCD